MAGNYNAQRPKVVPPHASLKVLRKVAGLTLEQVCSRVNQHLGTPDRVKPGTISGLENGHRGASPEFLAALEYAFGLDEGELTTAYLPRRTRDIELVGA